MSNFIVWSIDGCTMRTASERTGGASGVSEPDVAEADMRGDEQHGKRDAGRERGDSRQAAPAAKTAARQAHSCPDMPTTATDCISSGTGIAAWPIGFHGKPVKMKVRTHSNSANAAASEAMRPRSSVQNSRARAAASP